MIHEAAITLAIENMPTHFAAHVYYGQMAGWIRIPLGMEVCLVPCDIVLIIIIIIIKFVKRQNVKRLPWR